MNFIDKIKFSLLPYFSYKRVYKFNSKATKDLNKYYWLDGNSYNIIENKWVVEDGIPLGLYSHKLDAPLAKRVNITGMCEYCFALSELDRETEQHKIVDFIEKNILTERYEEITFSYWDLTYSHETNTNFVDGMGQGQLLSLLCRYSRLFPENHKKNLITMISNSFLINLDHPYGFVFQSKDQVIFEEYSRPLPCHHVLNGWIFSLTGLYDYLLFAELEGLTDPYLKAKKELLARTLQTLEQSLPQYDLGYWTTYQQPNEIGNIASIHYQVVHIAQLKALHFITDNDVFLRFSKTFLAQYNNPVYRLIALFNKTVIANFIKGGSLYRKK